VISQYYIKTLYEKRSNPDKHSMDDWFPLIALFCGLFLQVSLQMPQAARRVTQFHPVAGSYARMDRVSWILIIAGSLWEIQNLMV
jgi:hypothetical protein